MERWNCSAISISTAVPNRIAGSILPGYKLFKNDCFAHVQPIALALGTLISMCLMLSSALVDTQRLGIILVCTQNNAAIN